MNWINVNDERPDRSCYCIVACQGGNVASTYYSEEPEFFDHAHGRGISKQFLGQYGKHFELARRFGYKITHWMPLPVSPEVLNNSK